MRLLILALCLLVSSTAWAANPQFSDYPAGQVYRGPVALPDTSNGEAQAFRTRLRVGVRSPTDFGGHYNLVLWGCGTSCLTGAVVDRRSGQSVFLPSACCTAHWPPEGQNTIQGRIDSRMLIFIGQINEEGPDATHYYEVDGTRLTLIKTVPFAEAPLTGASNSTTAPATDCKGIASDLARLDCYDRQAGRK